MSKGIKAEKDNEGYPEKDKPLSDSLTELSYPGAERICVGAPLLDNNLFYEFGDNFPADAFTTPQWKGLYRLELYLHNNGFKVDKDTIINCADKIPEVAEMLEKAGGPEILDRATAINDSKNFDKYLAKIRNAYDKKMVYVAKEKELRELKKVALDEESQAVELIKIIDTTSIEISARVHKVDTYQTVHIDEHAFLAKSEKARADGLTFNGIPTNQPAWDKWLRGLANGRLYVLGAPTGCGKSLLNNSMLVSAAYGVLPQDRTSKHLVIDTGELIYEDDFLPRLISNMSGVFEYKLSDHTWDQNPMDKRRVLDALKKINKQKQIFWHQMPDFDGPQVRNLIRRMKHKEGIDCVWFDNIKINPNWKTAEQYAKIGDLAQYLKDAAVSLGIPVFAFIQLSNDATAQSKKKLNMEIHVDMFAGGRRVLQNADMGLVMDYMDPDDPYNDSRKLKIGKSRFTPWHRVGEHFIVEGDLRQCNLSIIQNQLTPRENRPNGLAQVVAEQGSILASGKEISNRLIGGIKPKEEPPSIDFEKLPDFD